MSSPKARINDFFISAKKIADSWKLPKPIFPLRTRWTSSYDTLFAGEGDIITDEKKIIDFALNKGRLILSSRAGEGKTCMLRRLYINALELKIAPLMLDLKQWGLNDYDAWKDWTSGNLMDVGADFLLTKFSGTEIGTLEFDQLPPNIKKLVLVDGLNEISTTVGTEILQIMDSLVRNQMQTSVLIADRSVRRDLPSSDRWTIGTILPLEKEEILVYRSDLEDADAAVLKSPFFLNVSLQSPAGKRGLGTLRTQSLSARLPLTDDEMTATAKAAYDAYLATKSRVFDLSCFRETVGEEVVRKLCSTSDLVVSHNGEAYFSHHIIHDYLCSRYLATLSSSEWTPAIFSAVSFDSASFDAIAMAFEQLDSSRADIFLRALYDWNLYAAGYALGQISANESFANLDLRTMIYAMLAEKRFDLVVATRQRATDALMLMKFEDAKPFQTAPSFDAICEALSAVQGQNDWFDRWKEIFLTHASDCVGLEQLQALTDADSVIGWTMANVAKRAHVEKKDILALASWLDTQNATVRWRIIHVLGAYPYKEIISTLSKTLDGDVDLNVRYGAVRSLVELAARGSDNIRSQVAQVLTDRKKKIMEQPRIRIELQNAIVLAKNVIPSDWLSFATNVIREFYIEADTIEERDEWRATHTAVETYCSS